MTDLAQWMTTEQVAGALKHGIKWYWSETLKMWVTIPEE